VRNIVGAGGVGVYNLDVEYSDSQGLIFHRKLKKGGCETLYGIVVSKAILDSVEFQHSVNESKDCILKAKKELLSTKKSHFNQGQTVDHCAICNGIVPEQTTDKTATPPTPLNSIINTTESIQQLQVHHISPQQSADSNGNIGQTFHKNNLGNLVCLCDECHMAHHSGKITIRGWISTLHGKFLDFSINNKQTETEVRARMELTN
jgi:hypothetical protein